MFEKLKKWFGKKEEKLGAGVSKPYVSLSEEPKAEITEAAVALNDAVAASEPRVVYAPKREEAVEAPKGQSGVEGGILVTGGAVPPFSGTVTVEAPANASVDVKVEPPTVTVETANIPSVIAVENADEKITRLNSEAEKLSLERKARRAKANAKYRMKKAKKK